MVAQTILVPKFWNAIFYSLKVQVLLFVCFDWLMERKNLPWDTFIRLWIELKKQLKNEGKKDTKKYLK